MAQRQVGRPRNQQANEVRQRLIEVAQPLFAAKGYGQVSTRSIAEAAGSNISMIRYYFGNKAGLFEACISEFYQPLIANLEQMSPLQHANIEQFILSYYQQLIEIPRWPQLMMTSAELDSGTEQRAAVERVISKPQQLLLELLHRDGVLKPGIDPTMAAHTVIATILFPFLMPELFRQKAGLKLDRQSLPALAHHQAQILQHGLLAETKPK